MSTEAALISLGTAAVRTAAKLWLGDHKVAAEVGASAIDLLSARLATQRDKRKFNRMIENFVEAIVDRLDPIVAAEFRSMPENEVLAAIDAVILTFANAPLVDEDLFAADLDARHLGNSIRKHVPNLTRLLSFDGEQLYDLLLRECSGYVIEISRGLPQFTQNAMTELLRRDTQIIEAMREVLARLPPRDRTAGFEYDYRQLVARKLDYVELFGVTLTDATRRYPLSVSYISLTVSKEDDESVLSARVEYLLARNQRLFIRGEAGLGKTTLLQWIAVRSARRDFPAVLSDWNDTVPFLVPLRRYSDRRLPAPEEFLDELGRHIADGMPHTWVHEKMRSGRAILLVDGVDELSASRRDEVRSWLRDLVEEFRDARFVITSRPGATQPEWLLQEEFAVLDLEPMTLQDVRVFVGRWHQAMRMLCSDDEARAEIDAYESGMIDRLDANSHMRKLAGYPLLCALLCALHKDRRSVLPSNRMELYEVALQMILERRDAERGIATPLGLNRTEKTLLLSNLAYWLIRNGRTDVEVPRATSQFAQQLALMPQVKAGAETVYRHLLERSGMLREPVVGRVDFIHRTFQEYLAARAAIASADDVGTLVANAHMDQWHEVITMAVGHATHRQREELLSGLLSRADNEREYHDVLELLALASLETTPELSRDLRTEIHTRAALLLPPQSLTAAKSFASAGAFVLDLLADTRPRMAKETVATIRAIAETGLEEALPILSRYVSDSRKTVQDELFRSWSKFDSDAYIEAVLSQMPVAFLSMDNPLKFMVLKHLHKVRNLRLWVLPNLDVSLSLLPRSVTELSVVNWDASPSDCLVRTSDRFCLPDLDLPELVRLELDNVGIDSFEPLISLPRFATLSLIHGGGLEQLVAMKAKWNLKNLELHYTQNLMDLTQLAFLEKPESLAFQSCSKLVRFDGIDRWSESLVELSIFGGPPIDLTPIAGLSNLKRLNLSETPVSDIRPLRKLQALERLSLVGGSIRDFRPIAALESLKKLVVYSDDPGTHAELLKLVPHVRLTHVTSSRVLESWPPSDGEAR